MRIGARFENGCLVGYNVIMQDEMNQKFKEGEFYEIKVIKSNKNTKISILQNAALYKWFQLVAMACNAAGIDLRLIMPKRAPLPVTEYNFKNIVFKPVFKVLYGKDSCADLTPESLQKTVNAIDNELLLKNGVNVPFPDRRYGADYYDS